MIQVPLKSSHPSLLICENRNAASVFEPVPLHTLFALTDISVYHDLWPTAFGVAEMWLKSQTLLYSKSERIQIERG